MALYPFFPCINVTLQRGCRGTLVLWPEREVSSPLPLFSKGAAGGARGRPEQLRINYYTGGDSPGAYKAAHNTISDR